MQNTQLTSNFIPTIWAAEALVSLRDNLVFGALCNRKYQGEIEKYGDRVKINSTGHIDFHGYVPGITRLVTQDITDFQQELVIDQGRYFSFGVNDVVEKQANISLTSANAEQAGYDGAVTIDKYLANHFVDTPADNMIGDDEHPKNFTQSEQFFNALSEIEKVHAYRSTPLKGRVVVIPPDAKQYLVTDTRHTITAAVPDRAKKAVEDAYVGHTLTYDVYVSNNVAYTEENNVKKFKIMAFYFETIALAEQIALTNEQLRPTDDFKTITRGLVYFGTKVVRPETLVTLTATFAPILP